MHFTELKYYFLSVLVVYRTIFLYYTPHDWMIVQSIKTQTRFPLNQINLTNMNAHSKTRFDTGVRLSGIWLKYMLIGSVVNRQCLMTKLNSCSNMPNIYHSFMQRTTYHKLDIWINCNGKQIYCYRAKLCYMNGPFSLFFCTCLAEQVTTAALYSSTTSALESMQLRDIKRSLHLTIL